MKTKVAGIGFINRAGGLRVLGFEGLGFGVERCSV